MQKLTHIADYYRAFQRYDKLGAITSLTVTPISIYIPKGSIQFLTSHV